MKGRPLRLFVTIDPPEGARRAMLGLLAGLSIDPRHKVTPLDQVHLTVQFIGDTEERELPNVVESVRRAAAGIGTFSLSPQRLISLPERGPVRLVALETDAPTALLELHRRLAHRLARSPRAKAGDRFLPHLTLCRFSGEALPGRVDRSVSLPPFPVERVRLMKSFLRPRGAQHVCLEEVAL
ncbi:MAG: RNA 2',3'-cyclic phosphodiesterase [Phycisphaeraceae bacterium]|nr:RNA 2',3'-cyclic phosphodiesterase [Phycisphaeraceae bacterium]